MNYERFELPNGMRVIVAPMPVMRSVSTAVWLGVGSRHEAAVDAGSAHLIEHLMFKGTVRRPTSRAISETLEGVGGIINAATDKETTVYWTKTASEHVGLSIDLLADMLLNSKLTPGNVRKEQAIIIEELGMSMDDPQDWVHALLDEAMWPGHELGRDVAGTRESVLGLRRKTIHRFMSKHYGPNNAVLVVAGGVDAGHIRRLAAEHFGDWRPVSPGTFQPAPDARPDSSFLAQERPTEQVHLCIAFPGLSRYHPDRYVLDLATTILGGSTTSRLFLEVRERLALAYDVHMYTNKLADTGSIVIYAGVDASKAERTVKAIVHEIARLRKRVVSVRELERTVEYIRGRTYLGLEDTHAVASWLGSQALLMEDILSPEDLVRILKRVTPSDIRRVANDYLRSEVTRIAAIGPNVSGLVEAITS